MVLKTYDLHLGIGTVVCSYDLAMSLTDLMYINEGGVKNDTMTKLSHQIGSSLSDILFL